MTYNKVKVNVFLQPTVSRPVCPGIRPSSETGEQFFFPFMELVLRHLRHF
jgi:hypothetical protein